MSYKDIYKLQSISGAKAKCDFIKSHDEDTYFKSERNEKIIYYEKRLAHVFWETHGASNALCRSVLDF